MKPAATTLHGLAHAALMAAVAAAALGAAFACGRTQNIHDTPEVKSSACLSCHAAGYNAATNPVHVNKLPNTCQDCHSTQGWVPAQVQNHFWWPLQNKHVGPTCTACHTKGFRQGDTAADCQGCHQKDYDGATKPKHTGFPLDCKLCHDDTGFQPSTFKHPWPLDGLHATTACNLCHAGDPPRYKGTPTGCADCHQKDADAAKSPIHKGLPTTCKDCHTAAGWKPSSYLHTWPLQGKHVLVACSGCHAGPTPVYKGTTTDCYACHKAAADASTFPNHKSFPHTCLDCHQMSGWKPAITGPHPEAKFAITTGKHAGVPCQNCHVLAKGVSSGGANTDCINCHTGAHVAPAIDAWHLSRPDGGGPVPNYPTGSATTNYCLSCHPLGVK